MKSYKFYTVIDDIDFYGELKNKKQKFEVKASSDEEAWDKANKKASELCSDFGRVFEFSLTRIFEKE